MNRAEHGAGADFKGASSPAATRREGVESRLVVGFIVAAVLAIGALVLWAM